VNRTSGKIHGHMEGGYTYKILAVKAEGKRPFGGLRYKYKNNI
jgi:hypothetical protein